MHDHLTAEGHKTTDPQKEEGEISATDSLDPSQGQMVPADGGPVVVTNDRRKDSTHGKGLVTRTSRRNLPEGHTIAAKKQRSTTL